MRKRTLKISNVRIEASIVSEIHENLTAAVRQRSDRCVPTLPKDREDPIIDGSVGWQKCEPSVCVKRQRIQ